MSLIFISQELKSVFMMVTHPFIYAMSDWKEHIFRDTHTHTYGQSRNSSQSNGYLIYFVNAQSSVHMLNEMGSDDILLAKSVCFLYSTYRLILSQTQTHTTCTFITLSSIKKEKKTKENADWFMTSDFFEIPSTNYPYHPH